MIISWLLPSPSMGEGPGVRGPTGEGLRSEGFLKGRTHYA
jgi:hypothetical protein